MTRLRCSPPLGRVESALRSHGASYLSLAAEFLLTGSPCCCGRRRGTAPTSRRLSTGRAFRLILRVGRFDPIPPDAPSARFSSARPMACQRGDSRSTFRSDRFRMRRPMARLPKRFPAANAGYPQIPSLLNPRLRKPLKSCNPRAPRGPSRRSSCTGRTAEGAASLGAPPRRRGGDRRARSVAASNSTDLSTISG